MRAKDDKIIRAGRMRGPAGDSLTNEPDHMKSKKETLLIKKQRERKYYCQVNIIDYDTEIMHTGPRYLTIEDD